MDAGEQAILLRIIVGETDTWQGKSLHTALVEAARDAGLAGATVLRAIEGYGAHRRIHTARLVDVAPNLPMVVEIVDQEHNIEAFLPTVKQMVAEGLVTTKRVDVLLFRQQAGPA